MNGPSSPSLVASANEWRRLSVLKYSRLCSSTPWVSAVWALVEGEVPVFEKADLSDLLPDYSMVLAGAVSGDAGAVDRERFAKREASEMSSAVQFAMVSRRI